MAFHCTGPHVRDSERLCDEVQRGDLAGVSRCIQAGANGAVRNRFGRSALFEAIVSYLALGQEVEDIPGIDEEAANRRTIVEMLLPTAAG